MKSNHYILALNSLCNQNLSRETQTINLKFLKLIHVLSRWEKNKRKIDMFGNGGFVLLLLLSFSFSLYHCSVFSFFVSHKKSWFCPDLFAFHFVPLLPFFLEMFLFLLSDSISLYYLIFCFQGKTLPKMVKARKEGKVSKKLKQKPDYGPVKNRHTFRGSNHSMNPGI